MPRLRPSLQQPATPLRSQWDSARLRPPLRESLPRWRRPSVSLLRSAPQQAARFRLALLSLLARPRQRPAMAPRSPWQSGRTLPQQPALQLRWPRFRGFPPLLARHRFRPSQPRQPPQFRPLRPRFRPFRCASETVASTVPAALVASTAGVPAAVSAVPSMFVDSGATVPASDCYRPIRGARLCGRFTFDGLQSPASVTTVSVRASGVDCTDGRCARRSRGWFFILFATARREHDQAEHQMSESEPKRLIRRRASIATPLDL